jgi:LPS O-antigen subunit length determinant protein (WzzB/FepE family)
VSPETTKTPMTDRVENVSTQSSSQSNLFDLRILIRNLWHWKFAIIFVTAIGAIVGVKDAMNFSPKFTAQMVVEPILQSGSSMRQNSGGLMSAARSFGIVGATVSKATPFDHFKQTLRSRNLAEILQNKYELLQKVYSGSWDPVKKAWKKQENDETSIRQKIRKRFHFNSPQSPNLSTLAAYVGGQIKIVRVARTPFYKISVMHGNRDFALFLLKAASEEADRLIGNHDRKQQKERKNYLEAQLKTVKLTEVRSALVALLMQQEQRAMLTNSKPPFSYKILEEPWVGNRPDEPQLLSIIGVPTAGGFALMLVIATMIISFRLE